MFHGQEGAGSKDSTCSIASNTTVDLETAIEKTGCGRFNWMIILLAFPVASTSVFVTGSMSYVISTAAPDLGLTPFGKAMLQSAPYAGMIVSGYFWGFLSDAFGRKKLMVIGFLVDCFLNVCAGLFMSLPIILTFKFLSGLMMCGPYAIFMVYMSEVFAQQHRDMASQFMGVFTSVGSIIQTGIALWLIPLELPPWIPFATWQLFVILGGLPSLICGISCIFFFESPKFLVDKGQAERALSVCRGIFTINTGQPQLSYPVNKIQVNDTTTKKPICSRLLREISELLRPPFLMKTIIANIIFIVMFASQNTLRLWMPEIFTRMENSTVTNLIGLCPLIASGDDKAESKIVVPNDSVYINMAVIHCCCLIGHLTFIFVVRCLNKKLLLRDKIGSGWVTCYKHVSVEVLAMASFKSWAFLAPAISVVLLWLVSGDETDGAAWKISQYSASCFACEGVFSSVVAGGCIFIVPWLHAYIVLLPISIFLALDEVSIYAFLGAIAQLFPTHLRAKSVSLAMVLGRVAIFFGNFLLSNVMYSDCELMFYTLAGGSVGVVLILVLLSFKPYDDSKQYR